MKNKYVKKDVYNYLIDYIKKNKKIDSYLKNIFFLVDKNGELCCIRQNVVTNNNGIDDVLFELSKIQMINGKFITNSMAICDTSILRYKKNPTANLNLISILDNSALRKGYCSILLHTFENYLKQEKISAFKGIFYPLAIKNAEKKFNPIESAFYFYKKNNCKLINKTTSKQIKKINSLSVVDEISIIKTNKNFRTLKIHQMGDILVLTGYKCAYNLKMINEFEAEL